VLIFLGDGARLADLGRASYQGHAAPHDQLYFAGDPSYAPPELLYRQRGRDWREQCQACDMYLLGSLACFLFANAQMTAATFSLLAPEHRPSQWGGSFADVMLFLRDAWSAALTEIEEHFPAAARADLAAAIRQLTDPDPALRGHPLARASIGSSYALDRYVSLFNLLARRQEVAIASRAA
jgi:hypothetical protein